MDISDFYPIHRSGMASYHCQIRYNEKSWNNTPFRASFQLKKKIPDLIQCTAQWPNVPNDGKPPAYLAVYRRLSMDSPTA